MADPLKTTIAHRCFGGLAIVDVQMENPYSFLKNNTSIIIFKLLTIKGHFSLAFLDVFNNFTRIMTRWQNFPRIEGRGWSNALGSKERVWHGGVEF